MPPHTERPSENIFPTDMFSDGLKTSPRNRSRPNPRRSFHISRQTVCIMHAV
ncbi:hypothetical protein [Neisseria sp. P0008.S010]|uniref:hypothetical protein n=1 Tax=Neisseria sp. P0008.S010 TaxID=3436707 RepID=UPI000AE1B5DC